MDVSGTVDSSVVRMEIGLGNCGLGRIYGYEWNSWYFSGEKGDWVRELSAWENIWMWVEQLIFQGWEWWLC